jgi:SAM-dependent methyltransferase
MEMVGKQLKPWFGPGGDRTLAQQLAGLDVLRARVPGCSVLDVGCAEGAVSLQLCDDGAAAVHGIDIRPDFVEHANAARGDRAALFEVADANTYTPKRSYDFVLMLAVLHKLADPSAAAARLAAAGRFVVVRLPPEHAPKIRDARSGFKPHAVHRVLLNSGFRALHITKGAFDEWMGYYIREG